MKTTLNAKKGTTPLSYLSPEDSKKYICCKINGRIRELNTPFDENGEVEVEYLDLTDSDATRIYTTSLRYLVAWAVKEVNPKLHVRFFYNISRCLFAKVMYPKNFKVTNSFVKKVEAKMRQLVDLDIPFTRTRLSKQEALQRYKADHRNDKINVLRYRSENFVHLYETKHGDMEYNDYLYGLMVPSSGYLNKFALRFYIPGFLIQVPRAECNGEIPPFSDELKFATSLASTSHWAENNELSTASDINRFLKEYGSMALINLSEARVNNMLSDLGADIVNRSDTIRLICVAGPSSSGKTSFANRLLYELMSRGLRPIRISIDNFYIPKGELPEGTDIESIEALDLDYFNDFITKLIQGESVPNPVYDFKSAKRTFLKPISLAENQPIIIEGIHALNNKMTAGIPDYQKYKIYIAPQPQVNIDNHSPISMTDMRLLRRIARDSRTRGSSAAETIDMWPNVRNGEFNYIYPTQENADFVFDSFLPYEPCVLRNIVLPQLEAIKPDDAQYLTAQRLKSLVRYFLPVKIDDIPCNSLMREFVGGSSFKDAR